MKSNDDPSKQKMKGQTQVKHDILEKYLGPWLLKISQVNPEIQYIDGFAGWGRYEDGSPGSPLITMNVAKHILEEEYGSVKQRLDCLSCTFVEKNKPNFAELKEDVDDLQKDCPPEIEVDCENAEFENFALVYLEEERSNPKPAFIFIDPFGFSGLPFEIVNNLISLRPKGIEIFITFVAGEMARFIDSDTHATAITEILGTDNWEERIDTSLPKENIAEQILQIYQNQLRQEANVEYIWPFQMKREDKDETVYHLIHATNHFGGFKLMKDIMFNEGATGEFAYYGPNQYRYLDEQKSITEFGEASDQEDKRRVEDLADQLHEAFPKSQRMTFWELMKRTYQGTPLIEKHYRKAIYLLEDQEKAEIINQPEKPNGTKQGLNNDDEIIFREIIGLSDFI